MTDRPFLHFCLQYCCFHMSIGQHSVEVNPKVSQMICSLDYRSIKRDCCHHFACCCVVKSAPLSLCLFVLYGNKNEIQSGKAQKAQKLNPFCREPRAIKGSLKKAWDRSQSQTLNNIIQCLWSQYSLDVSVYSLWAFLDLLFFCSVYYVYIVARRIFKTGLGFYFYLWVYWLYCYVLHRWMCAFVVFVVIV